MTVHLFPHPQGSPAWLAMRGPRADGGAWYGASETRVTGGYGSYGGAMGRLWALKATGHQDPPDAATRRMYREGHAMEGPALAVWAEETRREVRPGPTLYQDGGFLSASLDGAAGWEPVEAKWVTAGNPDYDLWTEEAIPFGVELQVLQQAALVEEHIGARIEAGHVVAAILGRWGVDYRVYRIALTPERRDLWGDLWGDYPERWHAAYVRTRTPPPDADADDVAVLVDPIRVRRRDATPEELAMVAAFAAADAERARLAKIAREAEATCDDARDKLARHLGPDVLLPGLTHRSRKGCSPRLTLEK